MPKFKLSSRCLLTNSRKAKPHQLVIAAQNGRMVVLRNGQAFPWPKDVKLIVKGRSTHTKMLEHLKKLSEAGSTKV